jgi:hypothetical protein
MDVMCHSQVPPRTRIVLGGFDEDTPPPTPTDLFRRTARQRDVSRTEGEAGWKKKGEAAGDG